jgi:diguanylate cyclase (GGDEF)-like protein/PAS domain S-box-containing protein
MTFSMTQSKINVLLIEDDEDDYILTADLLAQVVGTKYSIAWVSSYAMGRTELLNGKHDVCLVDYRLGEGDGIQLIREAILSGCRVPMILLTGQEEREIDLWATEVGAADFLAKHRLDPQLLERSIRYAIAHGQTLETLRESENRFRSLVESANDAIVLTDQSGSIQSWNKSAQTIYSYSGDEIHGKPLSTLFTNTSDVSVTDGVSADPALMSQMLHSNNKAVNLTGQRKDGTEFPLEISISSWQTAQGTFYSGIIRDITDRKALEHQLTHQALHDPLTKLANRVLFRDRVEHAIHRSGRKQAAVTVMFLDLDNFKSVNDSLGHAAGDELLVAVTGRLESCLRSSDTPARLGGDEFAILVEDVVVADEVNAIAERIRSALHAPYTVCGTEVFISASIGIATSANDDQSPEELLRNADLAMYMSKANGKNRCTTYDDQMHDLLVKRVRLEADMRSAIEKKQFELYYQPIIDLHSEKVIAMEALVRWNHPEHGLIPPLDFIPLAEEIGLIVPLGTWILNEACRQASMWQIEHGLEGALSVTVNVAGRQFQEEGLVEAVANALSESNLPAKSLILEITEGTMLLNTEATVVTLNALKTLGVGLAIDDFGTGYSSLSYLQRFPVDILKIDKSFVDRLAVGSEGAAVAKAIITMSETLNLKTIAEGIESLGQQAELKSLGCEFGQGYHFTKPLRAIDMNDFLHASTKPRNYSNAMPLRTGHRPLPTNVIS